jgi:hypothetical protein
MLGQMNQFRLFIFLIAFLATQSLQATRYFVCSYGNNTDGLSPATGWTQLSQVNSRTFLPGDTLFFEGGKTFTGHLEFDASDGNNPAIPFVLTNFGAGRSTINTTQITNCGFKATNTSGIYIENLNFIGPGNGNPSSSDGILFFTNLPTGYLQNIRIRNATVSGFGFCGIRFYSNYQQGIQAGFKDVWIDSCEVKNCRENGIVSLAYDDQQTTTYQHFNFKITNSVIHHITGYAANNHKGSGIVLSQVDSALIERCEAYENGTLNTACGGPGGIWVFAANRVTIQYCESHHNSAGSGCDGLGFDLDGGVTNSKIQYCYSHDNDGAGILLGNFWGARPWGNNVVRYNISVRDAKTNNSPVTLFTAPNTQWNRLDFYHNTIVAYTSPNNTYPSFSAFQMTDYGDQMNGVNCFNNIFQTFGGLPYIHIPTTFVAGQPHFANNLYWASGASGIFYYGANVTGLNAFRALGPNCESWNGNPSGQEADPQLTNVLAAAPTIYPAALNSLSSFKLPIGSPAIDSAPNLQSFLGASTGGVDFFGNTTPFNGIADAGAHEYSIPANDFTSYSKAMPLNPSPNPATESIRIDLSNWISRPLKFSLFDQTGRKVTEIDYTDSNPIFECSLNGIPSGFYTLCIKGKNQERYGNLIVQPK